MRTGCFSVSHDDCGKEFNLMKKLLRAMAALALAVLICSLCNVAACFVNTPRMNENAAQAVQMLMWQGSQPEVVGGFPSARLDNFTAVLMIKTAAYTGPESLLVRAFGGMRTELQAEEGEDDWEAFCTIADGSESPSGGLSYLRYWHGYILPLRLLLCLLNFSNIQMLLLFVQTALLVLVALQIVRRKLSMILPGFIVAYFFMMPAAMGICVQYVSVALLTLSACAVLLCLNERIDRAIGLPGFFSLVGLLTNYFDLLTFPLVTLGFPLVLCVCLDLRSKGGRGAFRVNGLWRTVSLAVACSAAWAAGYAGMWMMKWLLAAVFFGPMWVASIAGQMRLRVSSASNGEHFSRLDVVRRNMHVLTDRASYLLIGAMTAISLLASAVHKTLRERAMGRTLRVDIRVIALLIPAALPFLWILVMANHSFDHWYYTFRILSCTVFALCALPAFAVQSEKTGE